MLIDTVIEQLKTKASEINKCLEGQIIISINDGEVGYIVVQNDLPVSYKEVPLGDLENSGFLSNTSSTRKAQLPLRKIWNKLSVHLLNIKHKQALAIACKMAGIPEDVSAKLLGLKDYRSFEESLYGRRGKKPRGGAVRALWKSASKSPDLSGDISDYQKFFNDFKTRFMRHYQNF